MEACSAISSLLSKEDIELLIIPIINAAAKVIKILYPTHLLLPMQSILCPIPSPPRAINPLPHPSPPPHAINPLPHPISSPCNQSSAPPHLLLPMQSILCPTPSPPPHAINPLPHPISSPCNQSSASSPCNQSSASPHLLLIAFISLGQIVASKVHGCRQILRGLCCG